ncbi:MAG: glycoside hydrolase [Mucilaginibacter sp.]
MRKTIGFITAFNLMILFAWAQPGRDTVITINIDFSKTAQTIDNIGTSACWFSEGIGKYWPVEKREKIAQLLFSRKFDSAGNPEGIGVSAFRFNIGAGTSEQGDSSGIKDFRKRTECFLNPNGTYDWSKQAGYQYFLKKANDYGVETLIGFSNSPPVQFTKNGLGYKTEKDYAANLKPEFYEAYANFLAQVAKHFDGEGIHLNYISPVNEPQWDWSNKYMAGSQEGSPWKNDDIFKIVKALDKSLGQQKLDSKILITEAGQLNYLYGGKTGTSQQIQQFFAPKSQLFLGDLRHVPKIAGGHGYFTEANDSILTNVRRHVADTTKAYGVNYWQTEYSMLADGYKEGSKDRRTAMDCALFLAKVIHTDLTVGNAAAWQFWNAFEPGNSDFNTRYYLIALKAQPDFKDGDFTATKNLWALGHYSRFVRPGMQRLIANTDIPAAQQKNLMVSAYKDKNNKLVIVCINYGKDAIKLQLDLRNTQRRYKELTTYLTTGDKDVNMKALSTQSYLKAIMMPARSIASMLVD